MKIVLATGIYPPDVGGPATYVERLAGELEKRGFEVVVVTYGRDSGIGNRESGIGSRKYNKSPIPNPESQIPNPKPRIPDESLNVKKIKYGFLPIIRWFRYAKVLRSAGADADIVYAFSIVSCGVPLKLARLKKPKKVLRLGGDFFWERCVELGGRLSLGSWYKERSIVARCSLLVSRWVLGSFDHVVFSTEFQKEIYSKHCSNLPSYSVIENAVPEGSPEPHVRHDPFRLIYMGRFVACKNLPALIYVVQQLPSVRLTMVGDGPTGRLMRLLVARLHVDDRVMFAAPVFGEEKRKLFESHDLMVIPSFTEISPNTALEARASGLPVLLTEETGLSPVLGAAMVMRDLRTPESIADAVMEVMGGYKAIARAAAEKLPGRGWNDVGEEHVELFYGILGESN